MRTCSFEYELAVPYVPSDADELDGCPPFPFPYLGSLLPDGWHRAGQSWVVGTGDAALDADEFRRSLTGYIRHNPGHGFGIVDDDGCTATVAAFKPTEE